MSETPRTDAALQNTDDGKGCATSALYVFASFARTLERELAAERAAREQAAARLAECKTILTTGGPSLATRALKVLDLLNATSPPPILAELERLRAENRKLADTVIGWSRLVERDEQLRAIEALRGTHDCGCEVCSRTSTLCPATASSYALRIIELESELAALKAELELLKCENTYTCHKCGLRAHVDEQPCPLCGARAELAALKLKMEVAKTKFGICRDTVNQRYTHTRDSNGDYLLWLSRKLNEALSQLNESVCVGKLPDPTPEQAKCRHEFWMASKPQPRRCRECGLTMWDAAD